MYVRPGFTLVQGRELCSSSCSCPQVSAAAAVLGVPVQASEHEIQAAFKRKVKATHPDSSGGSSASSMDQLVSARQVLMHNAKLVPALAALGGGKKQQQQPQQRDIGRPVAQEIKDKFGVEPVNLKKNL